MSDLVDALRRLLTVRAEYGAAPLEAARTAATDVANALRELDLEPIEEIVTLYSMLGKGFLVGLQQSTDFLWAAENFQENVATAMDFADQPEPFSDSVDWFPLGCGGMVVWLRGSDGHRPLAWRSTSMDFRQPAYTGGLVSVLHTWADRFSTGRYTVIDGYPEHTDKLFDDPDELMAANGL